VDDLGGSPVSVAITFRVKYGGELRPSGWVEVMRPELESMAKYLE